MSQGWTIPPEVDREMTPLVRAFFQAQMTVMQSRIDELEAKVERLERQLKLLNKFGHVDPAKGVEPTPTPRQKSTKKKRGGQPGRQGRVVPAHR